MRPVITIILLRDDNGQEQSDITACPPEECTFQISDHWERSEIHHWFSAGAHFPSTGQPVTECGRDSKASSFLGMAEIP